MNKGSYSGFGRDGKVADARMLTFDLDDGTGSAIATGAKARYKTVPFDCTIVGWRLMGNVSGSIVLDVWADRAANFPPTVADTVTGTSKPTLSSGVFAENTDLHSWICDLDLGDVIEINVDSCTTTVRAVLELLAVPR